LNILGSAKRLCDDATRRELLQAGGSSLLGLSLADLLRAPAAARGSTPLPHFGKAKNVLLLYLYGAMSQLETLDPKPDAPTEKRADMKRLLLLLVALIAVPLLVYGALTRTGGRGYFSPDTLESRSQEETYLVWWGFHYYRYPLVEYLMEQGYWSPQQTQAPRWIKTFHWNYRWRHGHSRFDKEFTAYATEWIKWSDSNPELAATLWPRVLTTLRSHRVDGFGDSLSLMSIARDSKTIPDFEGRLKAEGLE
jgi:hypothetical protein